MDVKTGSSAYDLEMATKKSSKYNEGVFTVQGENGNKLKQDDGKVDQDDVKQTGCCTSMGGLASSIRQSLGDTKILVHILVATFAIASWADLNAMWSELPLLTLSAPEEWTLPSYITIIGQIANVGPIIFIIVSYLFPRSHPKLETWVSFGVIVSSLVAAFLTAFFWDKTSYLFGQERSTGLLSLNFLLAVGDCTTSVSFYAFMSLLKPQYIASLLFGEGMSGFLPGMLALIQGAGEIICVNGSAPNTTYPNSTYSNTTETTPAYEPVVYPMYVQPLFSVRVYFIIISVIIGFSAAAFLVLISSSYCRTEFVASPFSAWEKQQRRLSSTYGAVEDSLESNERSSDGTTEKYEGGGEIVHRNGSARRSQRTEGEVGNGGIDGPYSARDAKFDEGAENDDLHRDAQITFSGDKRLGGNTESESQPRSLRAWLASLVHLENLTTSRFSILLVVLVVINMTMTTFLPTIQIYTVLPYGLEYYHLTTSLGQFANPVACLLAVVLLAESTWVIVMVTFLGQIIVAYLTYVAATSPEPPLYDKSGGGELSVSLWILVSLLLIYAKVCVAGVLRKYGGRNALIWAGFMTQVGTSIGAVVGFLLVNYYKVFKDAPYC